MCVSAFSGTCLTPKLAKEDFSKDRRIEWPQTKEEKVGSQFQLVTAATKINVGMPCLVLELLPMKCS